MDIAQDSPETVILAEDEASLYLQATTKAVWAPKVFNDNYNYPLTTTRNTH